MIRPRYAIQLARTKLRSKRGILLTSIIVASLLFATLITAVILFTGAQKSAETFIKKSGNDRYLVKVTPVIPNEVTNLSAGDLSLEQIKAIKVFQKQYYDQLRAKYKTLGIEYNAATEESALMPAAWKPESLPEEQRVMINFRSPVIAALLAQKYTDYAKTATNKLSHLQAIASQYGASGYYQETPSYFPMLPNTRLIQNGKEDFGSSDLKAGDMGSYGYYTNAIYNASYQFSDEQLLTRYLLPYDKASLKGIPVIVSAQEGASLFGKQLNVGEEPKDAKEKVKWLATLQEKLNGHTYQVCYRSTAEQTMLTKIQRDYTDAKNNEANKEYIKPSLIYEYPTKACGDISVKSDTRTASEKAVETKADDIQKKLGTYIAPNHRLLTFQIVGIVNAQPYIDQATSAESYVKSLLVMQNYSWNLNIPTQAYESLPEALKFDDLADATRVQYNEIVDPAITAEFNPRVLEFATIEKARTFMNTETCPSSEMDCKKKFLSEPYGSNYLILDEIGKLFNKVATIAFPAVLALATIIIWFTVSRIMAENRKETAVYRAMGAKRFDITIIYITYVLIVALRIAIFSLVIGVIGAFAVNYFYGSQLTDIATAAFGIITDAPNFTLFDLSSPLIWAVVGLIFVISIIASIQPLIRNARRAPIRDLREE